MTAIPSIAMLMALLAPQPGTATLLTGYTQTVAFDGPGWISLTIDAPAGSSYEITQHIHQRLARDDAGCFVLARYDHFRLASFGLQTRFPTDAEPGDESPPDEPTFVVVDSDVSSVNQHPLVEGQSAVQPAPQIHYSRGRDPSKVQTDSPGFGGDCITWNRIPTDEMVNVVAFVGAAHGIVSSQFTARTFDGARITAESWGAGNVDVYREWDFHGGAYARAGNSWLNPAGEDTIPLAHDTTISLLREKTIDYHNSAVALFMRGRIYPPAPICISACDPGILSITGPTGRPVADPDYRTIDRQPGRGIRQLQDDNDLDFNDYSANLGRILVAEPTGGPYRYGIEAHAATATYAGGIPLGSYPFTLLVTADADYPACTKGTQIATAQDGHPICTA